MAHQGQSIHNPDTGQRMTFTTLTEDVLELTSVNPRTERPEPRHRHPNQESGAHVRLGLPDVRGRGGGATRPARRVDHHPRGAVHTFWNEGPEEAHSTQSFRPALRTAAFFETYFGLAAGGELDDKGMPGLLQLAVMIPEFGDEMRATKPPWPVQRTLAAVLGPIGRRRGYRATRERPS